MMLIEVQKKILIGQKTLMLQEKKKSNNLNENSVTSSITSITLNFFNDLKQKNNYRLVYYNSEKKNLIWQKSLTLKKDNKVKNK